MGMNMVSIILKKKAGEVLTTEEIRFVAQGAAKNTLPPEQLSAWLMAVCWRGMDDRETADLTLAMAYSGDVVDLSAIPGVCVDKHSTGGVGDTTTLVLVPLVAACGAPVAKMSGRALGHTGGTLDKLESIPGMRIYLDQAAFIDQVRRVGCAVVGQTQSLAPADKLLYALRDVTGTVDSLPLIASSIVSKKLAAGSGAIVLDVKTGNGALMPTLDASVALARAMVRIGKLAGKPTLALVTGMEEPLGSHVGNALEVKEAIDILAGRAAGPLLRVSLALGSQMLVAAGKAADLVQAEILLQKALASGAGLAKLRDMIAAQGGDPRVTEDVSLLPRARHLSPVPAERDGYVDHMDTVAIGRAAQLLGAGRETKEQAIDTAVGLVMHKRIGEAVAKGEPVATLHANDPALARQAAAVLARAVTIGGAQTAPPPLIHAIIMPDTEEYFT
ncbi:MAG: thymidine phosphorylase [Oscillospiraceae bacterium]|nr:thymidine phosphorylase [Oscillospiraceae bacterium]